MVLVIGHKGQDGSLLRQALALQGLRVLGVGREGLEVFDRLGNRVSNRPGKINLGQLVQEELPSEIYYLAAEHSSSEGESTAAISSASYAKYHQTNVSDFLAVLDAVKNHTPSSRVFYSSSCHVFGPGEHRSLSESSPFMPESYYGITKAQAIWLCQKFRREAGLHVSCGILFNHESHLRKKTFFTSKVILGALDVKKGLISEVFVRNLDARADWGYAPEFVEAFQILVRADNPGDFVIATGQTRTARDFVSAVFRSLDLDWTDYVREEEPVPLFSKNFEAADPSKLFTTTSWRPKWSFEDFVAQLVSDHHAHSEGRSV